MRGIHMWAMTRWGQGRILSLMTVTYHMDIEDNYEVLWLPLKFVQIRQIADIWPDYSADRELS